MVSSGLLARHLSTTGQEAGLGLLFGGVLGTLAGLGLGISPRVSRALMPLMTGLNGLPKLALGPLFIIWFGLGLQSKVLLLPQQGGAAEEKLVDVPPGGGDLPQNQQAQDDHQCPHTGAGGMGPGLHRPPPSRNWVSRSCQMARSSSTKWGVNFTSITRRGRGRSMTYSRTTLPGRGL